MLPSIIYFLVKILDGEAESGVTIVEPTRDTDATAGGIN